MLYRNDELVLQNKIIIEHNYIEEGLKFIERETILPSSRKRCDILFEDKNGIPLFVEVKQMVDDKAIEQILEYISLNGVSNSRFMLIANYPINEIYKIKLQELQIEYKSINKEQINIQLKSLIEVPKGNSPYRSKTNVIKKLNSHGTIANVIYEYVSNNLHTVDTPIICNISDGIMFQLVQSNKKFLSISTIGDRLLFHFPHGDRDNLYDKYKLIIPELYRFKDNYLDMENPMDKEPNQIDINLKYIKNLDYIKPLIDEAFKHAVMNR